MKIIKRNSDNVVIYAGPDISISEAGAVSQSGSLDTKSTTANCTLVDGVTLPADWPTDGGGGWFTHVAGVFTPTAEGAAKIAAKLLALKASLSSQLDAAVMAVYNKPMTLSEEYKEREAQAQAYKDAGYTGDVPPRVAGFATPAGLAANAAADLILSQATALRGALASLSDLRMQKYTIARATTAADAQATFDSCMAQVKAIAAAIG